MTDTAPLVHVLRVQVDPVSAGNDSVSEAGEAPFAGVVTRVAYIAAAAVTGANTNTRTLQATNRGAAGAGTTAIAAYALTSGNNLAASDAKEFTLSGTPANLVVAKGDVISFDSTHAASGLADTGGVAIIEITRS